MATNGLKLLMGDYNSDSETDDEPSELPAKRGHPNGNVNCPVSGDAVAPSVHTTSEYGAVC